MDGVEARGSVNCNKYLAGTGIGWFPMNHVHGPMHTMESLTAVVLTFVWAMRVAGVGPLPTQFTA